MNHMSSDVTIICYDFAINKLRTKITKCLKDYGLRLQYSVFLCRFDKNTAEQCINELSSILVDMNDDISPDDSLIILKCISPHSAITLLGEKIETNQPNCMIV